MKSNRGFTLVELLVVVAILAALLAVAGVFFGRYIGHGEEEAYATELQDIQTAVTAMLKDSSAHRLDSAQTGIHDMDLVTADGGALVLSNYLYNVGEDGFILSGCEYSFTIDGRVTQQTPP
jgi:prepilin-type N-terminal cleavage/methylation domain-containing protein